MENFQSEPSEDTSTLQASNLFMCDLIKITLNQPIRSDLMKSFLKYSLFRCLKDSDTEILFSVPSQPVKVSKCIILLSTFTQVLISTQSILFINCSDDLKTLCKKIFVRPESYNLTISEEKDPYKSISLCWELLKSDCILSWQWAQDVQVDQCKDDLKNFIYSISETSQESLRVRLQEIQVKIESGELPVKEEKNNKRGESWELDNESTYEESFNQVHGYQKTWDFPTRELYKVTEYNESLECSVSDEGSDLAAKLNDFSMKATNSITDRFPKFSFASLSLSETSYQNAYEAYKKSLNYIEQVDLACLTPEKSEPEFGKMYESFPVSSTQICTLSDSNTLKSALENRSERCNCTKCEIF